MAKSKKAKARAKKVERNKNNKVDKTFDKHRKKARKEEIKYQKQMLRRMLSYLIWRNDTNTLDS